VQITTSHFKVQTLQSSHLLINHSGLPIL